MMRYIQKAICGAKTFSDTPIYSQLQNIIFTTVEAQQYFSFISSNLIKLANKLHSLKIAFDLKHTITFTVEVKVDDL
jgi:phosphomannomutase